MKLRTKLFLWMGLIMGGTTFSLGALLLAHVREKETQAFIRNYQAIAHGVAEHVDESDRTTDALLSNALKALSARTKTRKISQATLIAMRDEFRVSNLYLFGADGRPLVTSNEILSPTYPQQKHYSTFSLFDVCPNYRSLSAAPNQVFNLPLTWLRDNDLPAKFAMVWDPEQSGILESSLNSDFVYELLRGHLALHKDIIGLRLSTPTGQVLGEASTTGKPSIAATPVEIFSPVISVTDRGDSYLLSRSVGRSHLGYCEAINKHTTDPTGAYYYVLHMDVSKQSLHTALGRFYIATGMVIVVAMASAFAVLYLGLESALQHMHRFHSHLLRASEAGKIPDSIDIASSDEIGQMCGTFNRLGDVLRNAQGQLLRAQKARIAGRVITQLMHDVRSPLAALDMAVRDADGLPEEKRLIIHEAVDRIRDIAQGTLRWQSVQPSKHSSSRRRPASTICSLLPSALTRIVSEKRVQYRSRAHIKISVQFDSSATSSFCSVSHNMLRRVLSNLIDNSVQAICTEGTVIVGLTATKNNARIAIEDNGRGIPNEVVALLGKEPTTYGKSNGNGLGFLHAHRWVKKRGGLLTVESEEGVGTTISIELPLAPTPAWHLEKISLAAGASVVVVDDDKTIHQIWHSKITENDGLRENIFEFHFSSPEALLRKIASLPTTTPLYFFIDQDYRNSKMTGIELAAKLIAKGTICMVTSHSEKVQLQQHCQAYGLKLIDKSLAAMIPVELADGGSNEAVPSRQVDAVLLDDDALTRRIWHTSAKDHAVLIDSYACSNDLYQSLRLYPPETAFYIDCELGDGIHGEKVAGSLFNRGFTNLYLATGYETEDIGECPWVKAVVGKQPFWLAADL